MMNLNLNIIDINKKRNIIGDWGLGIGDWGLGIGPNPQSPIPNPQSPIPNPHFYNFEKYESNKLIIKILNKINYIYLINRIKRLFYIY